MSKNVQLSFEFFPPKTQDLEGKMWDSITQLALLRPLFVSVTYGAGGTTRDYTHQIAKGILAKTDMKVAAHLTCVGATRDEVDNVARDHWNAGIHHIVALRGDPPKGTINYVPHEHGYAHATDLLRGLKKIGNFEISVAAFPEKHPESKSLEQDIEVLKAKDELGATRAITQYFFDNKFFLRLRDNAAKAGIKMPIVPGMIPIGHFSQLKRFSAMCGTSIPDAIVQKFDPLDDDHAARDKAAIELATEQCAGLIAEGIDKFHFYTMNRSDLITAVCKNLGIAPNSAV